MTYSAMEEVRNRGRFGQAVIFLVMIAALLLSFGSLAKADDAAEMVEAYAVLANDEALTYVQSEEEFHKLLNSVETYFSKVDEGEKLVSVEFGQPLVPKVVTVPKQDVKTSVEALGVIVKNVKSSTPALTVKVVKDISKEEEIPYEVEYQESQAVAAGTERIKQKGYNGVRYIEGWVTIENGKEISTEIIREEILAKPITEIVEEGVKDSKNTPVSSSAASAGKLIVPTNGGYLSSGFGQRDGRLHKGIDIARPDTYTIVAADTGRVTFAGSDGGYGNKVIIDHGNGMKTVYAHLSSILVKKGQVIEQGKRIGVMGQTGWSTGIHLHFEVLVNDEHKNPLNYISI